MRSAARGNATILRTLENILSRDAAFSSLWIVLARAYVRFQKAYVQPQHLMSAMGQKRTLRSFKPITGVSARSQNSLCVFSAAKNSGERSDDFSVRCTARPIRLRELTAMQTACRLSFGLLAGVARRLRPRLQVQRVVLAAVGSERPRAGRDPPAYPIVRLVPGNSENFTR